MYGSRNESKENRRRIRELHSLIATGSREQVQLALSPDLDLNFVYGARTCLQIAINRGSVGICQVLLNHGADANYFGIDGLTPINQASAIGHAEIILLLVQHGGDPEVADSCSNTPLNSAAAKGHLNVVKLLLEMNCIVDRSNNCLKSPLITASQHGYVDIVNALLQAEALLNFSDLKRRSSLFIATERNHLEVVKTLIKAGCDLNMGDQYGCTALYRAAKEDYQDILGQLIQAKADLNITDTSSCSPLFMSVGNQHWQAVKMLCEAGCDVNISERDTGFSPLLSSAKMDTLDEFGRQTNLEIMKTLLHSGASINQASKGGVTALHQAVLDGKDDMIDLLMKFGADVSCKTEADDSLLHAAVHNNSLSSVSRLISLSCPVNVKNKKGETPLFCAVDRSCHIEIVRSLLAVDCCLVDCCNLQEHASPLYKAALRNNYEAFRLLLDKGADVNLWTFRGTTPLWAACFCCSDPIIDATLACPQVLVNLGLDFFPIHVALERRHSAIALKLLRHGANVNSLARNFTGLLYHFLERNETASVIQLLKWGADAGYGRTQSRLKFKCCSVYTDAHPHLELEPLFVAFEKDNWLLMRLLCSSAFVPQYRVLMDLCDIVFRTNLIKEQGMSEQVLKFYREFFDCFCKNPRSLRESCRGIIRQSLKANPSAKVDKLTLPISLKKFLWFSDVPELYLDEEELESISIISR